MASLNEQAAAQQAAKEARKTEYREAAKLLRSNGMDDEYAAHLDALADAEDVEESP